MTTEAEIITYNSDVQGIKDAAAEVSDRREAPPPPAEPIDTGETATEGPGNTTLERRPPVNLDYSINVRDGAEELHNWRKQRDEERDSFNRAVMGSDAPQEDFSSLSLEEQYARAKDALREAENQLGLPKAREERDTRIADAQQKLAHLESLIAEQTKPEPAQSPLLPPQAAQAVENYRQQAIAELVTHYPEARDASGLARLQVEDPARFQQYQRDFTQADTSVRAARGLAIENNVAYAQHFAEAGKAEDAKFAKAHPELQKNKQAAQAIAQETVRLLGEAGIPENEVLASYHGVGQYPWLRSAGVQEILLKAARESLARKGMASRPRPIARPVQRPGAAGQVSHSPVGDLERRLSSTGNLKDAAKLVAARRRGK